jgi:hypothetical protein
MRHATRECLSHILQSLRSAIHGRVFAPRSASRAFTMRLMSATGNGLSSGNCAVPLDVLNPVSSPLNLARTDPRGKRLTWSKNAAYERRFYCLRTVAVGHAARLVDSLTPIRLVPISF